MKYLIKKIMVKAQLRLLKILLHENYYNEILFFQSLRLNKFDDKAFKESTLRSVFHQFDKKLSSGKFTDAFTKRFEDTLAMYRTDREIDSTFIQWAYDIIFYAKQNTSTINEPVTDPECENPEFRNFLFTLIQKRRSIRSFQRDKIAHELLEKILSTGLLAPTGCNRQNLAYLIVEEAEDKNYCQKLAGEPGAFVSDAPVGVVILADCRTYSNPYHRHQAFLESGAAIQNMMLYALSHNVGSIWLNWATTKPDALNDFYRSFNVPAYHLPTALLLFGYIKNPPPVFPVRKELTTCVFRS